MHDQSQKFETWLLDQSERVCELQREMCANPALGPENGGQGELKKALLVAGWLKEMGLPGPLWIEAPDKRVDSGIRPTLVSRIEGKNPRTLWLFAHLDVVPPGDASAWSSDPWEARREGDLVYGRGVEDNQQAAASMLILAQGLKTLEIVPELSLGLVFMADEECGSKYGLAHLLEAKGELFSPSDYYIVPDGGSETAVEIEIAEKAQLWLRFEVVGRQCHASMPQDGRNAFVAASHLVCELDKLNKIFNAENPLFRPSVSTFTPTRHDAGSTAINLLPGKDVFYMDCRLLPELDPESVYGEIKKILSRAASDFDVELSVNVEHFQKSTSTPPDTPVMAPLKEAIARVYGVKAKPVGIGGATVAAFLRQKNLPAVVWSCILGKCHQPGECSSLSATCRDAAVFARILMNRRAGSDA